MDRTAIRFVLIVTVAIFAAANVVAQQEPSADSPDLQPNAGGEEATVKRVVDGVMQPYVAQRQRMAGSHRWTRSPHLGTIVAVSLHGHRYFLFIWNGYRRGRSVHARNPLGDRRLHQDIHHHAVRPGHRPQPNRP